MTRRRGCARETMSGPNTDRRHLDGRGQRHSAVATRDLFEPELPGRRPPAHHDQIVEAGPFYYAEDYHQQYLEANPNGYCGLGGTGVSCPIGVGVSASLTCDGRRYRAATASSGLPLVVEPGPAGDPLRELHGDDRPRLTKARRR